MTCSSTASRFCSSSFRLSISVSGSSGKRFVFLPVVYFGFWKLRKKNHRFVWLTLAGYIFYGMWNYKFCALMAFSTLVSYFAGLGFLRWQEPGIRKLCLVVPITVDLLLLGFFKYFNFALDTLTRLGGWLLMPVHVSALDIVLPVGISFYTFHTITYIVDSYRGVVAPTKNIFEFSCYVSLFSQLVAGPIVRFRQIEADLENLDCADRKRWLDRGWSFFAIGMMKKVLIADTIAAVINPAVKDYGQLSTFGAWLCVLGYYLYIPLGGNRGSRWMLYRNMMITMLLGGLWHGASWTFVFWGGYHGVLLCIYRAYGERWDKLPGSIQRLGTFFLVVVGWVFFRSDSFGMAGTLLSRMFSWHPATFLPGIYALVVVVTLASAIAHFAPNTFEIKHEWRPWTIAGFATGYLACLVVIAGGHPSPFLYFQF